MTAVSLPADANSDTGGEFPHGVLLGRLGHEAGKGRLTRWGERRAVEPGPDAQQSDRDRAQERLQMGLRLAHIAGAAQATDAPSLCMGALNTRPCSIGSGELRGLLSGASGTQRQLVVARMQRDGA